MITQADFWRKRCSSDVRCKGSICNFLRDSKRQS